MLRLIVFIALAIASDIFALTPVSFYRLTTRDCSVDVALYGAKSFINLHDIIFIYFFEYNNCLLYILQNYYIFLIILELNTSKQPIRR